MVGCARWRLKVSPLIRLKSPTLKFTSPTPFEPPPKQEITVEKGRTETAPDGGRGGLRNDVWSGRS
jgi:hypothetical protein